MKTYYCHKEDLVRMFTFLSIECEATIINTKLHGIISEHNTVYFQIDTNVETEFVIDSYWYNRLIWEGKPEVDEIPF